MKTKMSKLFALVLAAVMLTAVLSACEISIGNNESGGTSTPGAASNTAPTTSGGDTSESSDTSKPNDPLDTSKPTEPPKVTGDDAISMNALAGSWYWHDGNSSVYIWIFDSVGNFIRIKTTRVNWSNWNGSTWAEVTMDSASHSIIKGNYRIRGHIIEFFSNQVSRTYSKEINPWGDKNNFPVTALLNTPLSNPSNYEDMILHFEFIDKMNLRFITIETPTLLGDSYDAIFGYYNGESHNITIPTHTIPSRAWPKDELPINMPEYTGGRIRNIRVFSSSSPKLTIYIDRATHDSLVNYIERLVQSGWSYSSYYESDFQALKRGDKDKSYVVILSKDKHELYVGFYIGNYYDGPEGEYKISLWK